MQLIENTNVPEDSVLSEPWLSVHFGALARMGLRGRMINTVKIVAPLTSLCV